jgi:hypothetical protein
LLSQLLYRPRRLKSYCSYAGGNCSGLLVTGTAIASKIANSMEPFCLK